MVYEPLYHALHIRSMYASVQSWKLELRFFFAKDEMAPDKNRCNSRILLKMQFLRKKKQNKTKQNKNNKRPKRHKSLFESKIPRPTTKEDTYCFFMIARSLVDNKVTAACSFDIKNINHKQLATNTGYVAIHYSNQGVSIASSLVQQNQLAASNNFITIFA